MKNAIILHAMGDTPESHWYPWLKAQLEAKGYEVWAPVLPDTDHPSIANWLPVIMENGKFTSETVIIGHSSGAAVILAVLEALPVKISQAIMVSGFLMFPEKWPILKEGYDWNKIKANADEIIFMNSDNDPYKCNDVQGRMMLEMAGGILIIPKGMGHMGSVSNNQILKEFPFLLRLIK